MFFSLASREIDVFSLSDPAVGKTPFSGNTPFSSQTGGKQVQNASFTDISVLALQNAPRLHTNHSKARSNGIFPTAGDAMAVDRRAILSHLSLLLPFPSHSKSRTLLAKVHERDNV